MGVREHYDNHLGKFYSWMMGDFNERVRECSQFLSDYSIVSNSALAIDLGCGHGIWSVALAKAGYKVISVDFNKQLLIELYSNKEDLPVLIVEDNIFRYLDNSKDIIPELIVCMGDTIAHMQSFDELKQLFSNCYKMLGPGGKFIVSYRDYSEPLVGNDRFIPVKSDESRIHTCFLEYEEDKVNVTDILHEFSNKKWEQLVSSYKKIRVTEKIVSDIASETGFTTIMSGLSNRLIHGIYQKEN